MPPPENDAAAAGPVQADLTQFIGGLAVQTLMHLGKVAHPGTDQRRTDLPNARYSIDLLGILQEKTKGNLTADESRYLSTVLNDLRLEYIQAAGGDKKETTETGKTKGNTGNTGIAI